MSSAKSTLRLIGACAALAALALAVSCQGFFPPAQIESITIQPTTATVPLNGTFQMSAFGVDTNGNQLGNVTTKVTWSSSDPSTITVGETTGLLTGVALGTDTTAVTITGAYEALTPQTASATVCVQGGTDFAISPPAGSTIGGEAFSGTAGNGGFTSSVQSGGQTLDVTTATTWTSSNTDALTITGGEDPAAVLTETVDTNTPVTVTATYTCDTTSFTLSEIITVQPEP
jgi:hypothetical protein